MMKTNEKIFREGVAAIVINKDKKVLMCEHAWIDEAWQFPQGGVEENEKKEGAILRELWEELGTKKFKIISKMDEKLHYLVPYYLRENQFDGQIQTYFLVLFTGEDEEIHFENQKKPEFKAKKWVSWDTPPLEVIYFKKIPYYKALKFFKKTYENLSTKDS